MTHMASMVLNPLLPVSVTNRRRTTGVTPIKFLLVLAAYAIRAAIAPPSHQSRLRKSHRSDAIESITGGRRAHFAAASAN